MSTEPPTEKQSAYLRKQGMTVPSTKKEASDMISKLIPSSGNKNYSYQKPVQKIDTVDLSKCPLDEDTQSNLIDEGYKDGWRFICYKFGVDKATTEANINSGPEKGLVVNNCAETRRLSGSI
jgi:hypothetical protein